MGIWIRALCTKTLGVLTAEDLLGATADGDFRMMAETQDLEDDVGEAAGDALRFEAAPGDFTEARMFYLAADADDAGGRFVQVTRDRGHDARVTVEGIVPRVPVEDTPTSHAIRDALEHTVETVSFCLSEADADGMGWPIAWHTAMWLAGRGDGIVETDGTWWDPETNEQL
jgi:hypothetical protein